MKLNQTIVLLYKFCYVHCLLKSHKYYFGSPAHPRKPFETPDYDPYKFLPNKEIHHSFP